jgi:HEAT repeat protein/tetratricopeptide (TPR) repeat protein
MDTTLPALQRVVDRYRRDVNQLAAGATPEALAALEAHLQRPLPADLRRFLALHNGATLFRSALRVRSTSEMTMASERAPQVVLFADGRADERWAFAELLSGQTAYGLWDGQRLDVVYGSFLTWFDGEIARIETRVVREEDIDALRHEVAPEDVPVLVRAGARALMAGRPDAAEELLLQATRRDPSHPRAWQLLGDALAVRDRVAARQAWQTALRRTQLPLSFPGAPCLSPEVVDALAPLPSQGLPAAQIEEWERELSRFLTEQVADVADEDSLALVVAATTQLVRSLVRRGRRRQARDVLSDALSRAAQFRCRVVPWALVLDLVQLEVGLGHHDAAEALLRRVRRQGPRDLLGAAHLFLAEIAVLRQEPWAEDALDDALAAGLDEEHKLVAALLRIERAVRHHRGPEAAAAADGIDRLARRVGVLRLEAWAALVQGDCARLQGDAASALTHYRRGFSLCAEREPECSGRLQLRMAELAWTEGRTGEALELASRGAELFRAIELPIREAWALVRLSRFLQPEDPYKAQQLRSIARERFVEADLAAGVAATDSLSEEFDGSRASSSTPSPSLVWHLERSTAHARARHDAQRARPPWDRSDAERPERRLGAHRLAIAACDVGVVTALAREMDACARAASVGRGRPTDPPVLRYVAAVDLLSGHRSYEAARVLLDHLFVKGVDGVMLRALQGAIARSPNAALVDGLLRCVERPGDQPARAVAAASELLGLRREPAATAPLVRLAEPQGSPMVRKAAIVALGRIGDRSVAEAIVLALQDVRLAEQAALALLMLGDRRGVDFHGRALVEQRTDLSGSPGEIVGRYGGPDHLLLLIRASEADGERATGALQGLGLLGDPRGVPALLKALSGRERRVMEVASGALSILSGRDDDPSEPGLRSRWHDWWEQHQDSMPAGVRFRHGQRFDCAMLLQRMSEPDAYLRRTAYDELVITSGEPLPFDADGPWRVQQAHLADWWRWWAYARDRFPAGRWVLDGKILA